MVNMGFPPVMEEPSGWALSIPAANPAPTSGFDTAPKKGAGICKVGWACASGCCAERRRRWFVGAACCCTCSRHQALNSLREASLSLH